MLTDLRYALAQLGRARQALHFNPEGSADCMQRCADALERCIEAAERQADAELDAIFADGADASDAFLASPPTQKEIESRYLAGADARARGE